MEQKRVTIDFDEIREIANKGNRRAALFLGLGLNAANDPRLQEYELTNISSIQLVQPGADNATLSHYKEEFGIWIVTCALRELIETFVVFIDAIHTACLTMAVYRRRITAQDANSQQQKFSFKGLEDKICRLKKEYGVKLNRPDLLLSINQARHCYTHRRGIVGSEDCQRNQDLQVKWLGIEIFAQTDSGQIIRLPFPLKEEVIMPEPATIKLKFVEKALSFKMGTYIKLPPDALAEICFFAQTCSGEVIQSTIEFARSIGVPVSTPSLTK